MQDQLDAYLEHLRSERQLSPQTLSGYGHDLSTLLAFCVAMLPRPRLVRAAAASVSMMRYETTRADNFIFPFFL